MCHVTWSSYQYDGLELCEECFAIWVQQQGRGCQRCAVQKHEQDVPPQPAGAIGAADKCGQCGRIRPVGGCWECTSTQTERETNSALGRGLDISGN